MATSLGSELEERRAHACRLSPDRALESLVEELVADGRLLRPETGWLAAP